MDPFFPTSTNIDSSNPIISLSDLAAWDFTSLEDNPEAQKFLIDAIVSNDQYRDDDDQKRKLETLGDIIQQLPSKAIHNLNIDSVPHPELTLDEMIELGTQSSFEDLQAELLNEPLKKKKAGRKPLTTTPNSKRKAQNRAAQRAFRERKERYVQELEDKIKELESVTLFTFSTPANDDTSTSTTGNNSGGLTNSEDPFTPPSSNESDNESNTSSNRSANGSKNSPAKVFAKEFCAKFTDGICLEDGQSSIVNDNSNKSTSAFTEYRDPTPFTPNIDNLFAGATPLAPLFEEHFINLGSFAPMSTPSEERVNPFMGDIVHNNGFATFDDLQNKSFLSCNKVWEKIQQHPMFDELEDEEIDQLCAELKSKARCSGHGPVVPEEEVDAALIKLEEK
ncbi:517_t:CDS:2 [Entrophospora sp. SA101]|nr:517_t:CDS:2 [Entrophospora sp. SA101]